MGYVPIVTRQESTPEKLRVFILAGQSNMQGYGKIYEGSNGAAGSNRGQLHAELAPKPGQLRATSPSTCSTPMGTDGTGGCMTSCRTARSWPPRRWPIGDAGAATLTLQNGVPCTVVVNAAGAYGNEVSWTLSDASGNVVASMDGQDESFPSPNTLVDVVTNDPNGEWTMLGSEDDWTVLDNAYLYFTERRR